jgi:hypothetical protein
MDWLKEILEKAVTEDGKLDVEAAMKQAATEFPKHAVPKKDYNDKVGELKTANDTITTLKGENAGNGGLQKKIEDYEAEIRKLNAEAENSKKAHALKEKLKDAVDPDYIIYKQGGVDKFSFDKDGNPVGVEDILKPMREAAPHLFKAEPGTDYRPNGGGTPPANNPWKKESFNLTEQGRLYKENPAMAKQMASAAGATI